MTKKELELRTELVEDYKRRFDDIKFINFSEKKGTTAVILKNGNVGVVRPCGKDEVLDVRVGILEAYIKATKVKKEPLLSSSHIIIKNPVTLENPCWDHAHIHCGIDHSQLIDHS